MKRLTHERCNGIKTGYWSPEKKEDLVNALAAYENTGLTPEEVKAVAEACKIYKSLGLTPDQIQALKERDTEKEPIKDTNSEVRYADDYICPNCSMHFIGTGIALFCYHCGQRLKWEARE